MKIQVKKWPLEILDIQDLVVGDTINISFDKDFESLFEFEVVG